MADEDIIELTDIVKEGHTPAQAANTAAQDPEAPATASMPDFGADLDELLQNYDKPAAKAAAAVNDSMTAPVFNQEDADHKVDPNEELELPPLSDLDALLEELGVQDNSPAVDAQKSDFAGDDLDSAPILGQEEPVVSDAAAPAAVEAADDDGIDLNELDALLDSVLASAPKPAQAAAPAPERAAAPAKDVVMPEAKPAPKEKPAAQAATSAPVPVSPDESEVEADVEALQAEVAALRAELADLRANMDKYAAAAAAKVIREELAVIAASLD